MCSLTGVENTASHPSQPLRVEEGQNVDFASSSTLITLKELTEFEDWGFLLQTSGDQRLRQEAQTRRLHHFSSESPEKPAESFRSAQNRAA